MVLLSVVSDVPMKDDNWWYYWYNVLNKSIACTQMCEEE